MARYVGAAAWVVGSALLVFAYDAFFGGMMGPKPHLASFSGPEEILTQTYGLTSHDSRSYDMTSCFREGERDAERATGHDAWLTCEGSDLSAGLRQADWGTADNVQCWPVERRREIYRDLPFTAFKLREFILAVGMNGKEVAANIEGARSLPRAEYAKRYYLNGELVFYDDPSPEIASIDCGGYSVTRVEIDTGAARPPPASP